MTKSSMKKEDKKNKLETDFTQCVPWNQIKEKWGKREYKRFCKFMQGQTCLQEGVYMVDIQTYVQQRNRGIKDPKVYD